MSETQLPYILHNPCKRDIDDPGNHKGYWTCTVKDENGKSYGYRHRQYYARANKVVLQPDEVVRHLCGNRWCVEVTHLAAGTVKDNNIDTVKLQIPQEIWKQVIDYPK